MLGSLLFVHKRFLVIIFCFTKEIFITTKKYPKKSFLQKKYPTERKFEKKLSNKKDAQGPYYWVQISTRKKSKLKVWHSYRKNSLNHSYKTQKCPFFKLEF